MQVPPPEDFTSKTGYWVQPPYRVRLPDAGFDLHSPWLAIARPMPDE